MAITQNWTVTTTIPPKSDPEVIEAIKFINDNVRVGQSVALADEESVKIAKKAIKHIQIDNDAARFRFVVGGDRVTYLKMLSG